MQSRIVRVCAVMAVACLFGAGAAWGSSAPAGAAPGGTITFSGAVLMGTCTSPGAGERADTRESAPARGECRSGENRTAYRVSANDIGDLPGVRLLEYARDRYGEAKVLTYVYD